MGKESLPPQSYSKRICGDEPFALQYHGPELRRTPITALFRKYENKHNVNEFLQQL